MFTADIVQFLVLLCVFASIFLLAQATFRFGFESATHSRAVNRRLRLLAKGRDRAEVISELRKHDLAETSRSGIFAKFYNSIRRNLIMAGVPYSMAQVLLITGAVFVVIVLLVTLTARSFGFVLTGGVIQLILAVAAATAIVLPYYLLSFLAERRRKKMQEQFPIALDIFVRALRSGHPVSSAMELLTQEMGDPIGSEFGLVSDEVSYGADMIEALETMAERWDLDDIRMFVTSLSVQKETGGNLAEVLDNLSKVIRQRTALYLKVRALSSEGRMTGWVLTIAPIFTFVMLFSMNPGFYLEVATDPIFFFGFPLLLAWYVIGVIIIRRMIDLKV